MCHRRKILLVQIDAEQPRAHCQVYERRTRNPNPSAFYDDDTPNMVQKLVRGRKVA